MKMVQSLCCCAVSVTWNGITVQSDTVTDPVLIYIEDLPVDPSATTIVSDHSSPGTLICRSEDRARVEWNIVTGYDVFGPEQTTDTFQQIRTGTGVTPSLSQLLLNREYNNGVTPAVNGIWHCRLNRVSSTVFEKEINVGIYSRTTGW